MKAYELGMSGKMWGCLGLYDDRKNGRRYLLQVDAPDTSGL